MLQVVLDTNVLLSAILFGGRPRQVLESAIEGGIRLYISEPIIAELEGLLRRPKFHFNSRLIQNIISELIGIAEWVEPQSTIRVVVEDPADNRILECAIEAKAQYLVTGDNHLLRLKEYGEITIVNPDQFIALIQHDMR